METVTSFNRLELLQVADAVAREKAIERDVVLMAMEDAIQKAARSRYGLENDIHAEIDRKSGEIRLERHLQVVEKIENDAIEIGIIEAQRRNPDAQVGDVIARVDHDDNLSKLTPHGWRDHFESDVNAQYDGILQRILGG